MIQTNRPNHKFPIDQNFYASIQKNVTSNYSDQLQSIAYDYKKMDKSSHPVPTTKQSEPILKQIPTLIKQRKISDNQNQPNSPEVTKCIIRNSQLIQQLIQENIQLKKQNLAKDQIINQLITNNDTSKVNVNQLRASTSQTERQQNNLQRKQNKQKNPFKSLEELSSLGFTFCNTEQKNNILESGQVSIKSSKSPIKLPKEFLIIPNQKKYFV